MNWSIVYRVTKASKLLPYQYLADLKTAKQALIYKPYFALVEMKKRYDGFSSEGMAAVHFRVSLWIVTKLET